jgi:hypothetical protein
VRAFSFLTIHSSVRAGESAPHHTTSLLVSTAATASLVRHRRTPSDVGECQESTTIPNLQQALQPRGVTHRSRRHSPSSGRAHTHTHTHTHTPAGSDLSYVRRRRRHVDHAIPSVTVTTVPLLDRKWQRSHHRGGNQQLSQTPSAITQSVRSTTRTGSCDDDSAARPCAHPQAISQCVPQLRACLCCYWP